MLQLSKVYHQLQDLSQRLALRAPRLHEALARLYELVERQPALQHRLDPMEAAHTVMAFPIEEPSFKKAMPLRPPLLTLCASDGSQILPERHFAADFFLLNLSRVVLHLGTTQKPTLESEATLFDSDALASELSISDPEVLAPTVELVTAMRQEMELRVLLEISRAARTTYPLLSLADGTLLCWHLKRLQPPILQQTFIVRYTHLLSQFRLQHLPVASYISSPGSREVINLLQHLLSPELAATQLTLERWLSDAAFFFGYLQKGERSAVFASRSEILQHYEPDDRIYFFYLHTGAEIARVEFPKWCYDAGTVDFLHAVVMDDVAKGGYYPMTLSEAHELAAVKPSEQEEFYRLLERLCTLQGYALNYSAKSLSKRIAKL